MDNATVVAGHGRVISRRVVLQAAAAASTLALAFALVMTLLQGKAEAQISFQQIVCPILINVANVFGSFFGGVVTPILNALLAAFGCVISG
ncbi:MAG: hypothetical protein M3163_05760 [Actinomycetota bacterium]|nr:hypothetical protein [Actinomycetota bacterium]